MSIETFPQTNRVYVWAKGYLRRLKTEGQEHAVDYLYEHVPEQFWDQVLNMVNHVKENG
jgi:hypothetical protein